jgi:DhnA family fructose-bisphosphate aldolase class Ia
MLLIASDHTARGKLGLGDDPVAMSDRYTLLERLVSALANPGVDGVLASADILEELAWLGALDDRLAIGTINRGGILGASWEIDDRVTAYDPEHIAEYGLDGGKTLLRIDLSDPNTARTIETVARITTELADYGVMSMIEALPYTKDSHGRAVLDQSIDALITTVAIASGLGSSSAHSWLKVTPSDRIAEVAAATTLPILMLGGESQAKPQELLNQWKMGLQESNVRGIVAGRSLLYPVDGNSEAAVRGAINIIHPTFSTHKGDPS